MSERQHRHGNQPEDRTRKWQQPGMEQTASSSDLESKILSRLGLGSEGMEEWQQRIRKIEEIAERGDADAFERISSSQYFKHAHKAVRIAALRGLLKLVKHDRGLIPPKPFIDALYDDEPQVRAAAVEALTAYDVRRLPKAVLDDVKTRLKNESKGEDEWVRMLIVHLLASLGDLAPIELLVNALQDEHWQVREAAVLALGPFMKHLTANQREQLDAMLYDDDDFVREAALLILREQIPTARLREDLRSQEGEKQSRAARVLGEMQDHSSETLNALQAIIHDPQGSSMAREAALLALAELHMPVDSMTLNRLLNDEDESVRTATSILQNTLNPRHEQEGEVAADHRVDNISKFRNKRKSTPDEEDKN